MERMFQILLTLEQVGVEGLVLFILIVFIKEVEEVLKLVMVDWELTGGDLVPTMEEEQA